MVITVYVRHYLTPEGIDYFHQEWFPKVLSIIEQQNGFLLLTHDHDKDSHDSRHLTLQFSSAATLDAWIAHPDHDSLLNALDAYRDRTYWEYAYIEAEIPSSILWEKVTLEN